MEDNTIAYLSYLSGGLAFALLALIAGYLWKKSLAPAHLFLASSMSFLWHAAIAFNYQHISLSREALLVFETLRYGAWISALLASLQFCVGELQARFRYSIHAIWLLSLISIFTLSVTGNDIIQDSNLLIWNSLLLSILGLVAVEQLFRNAQQLRLMKLISICIGSLFTYDIYLFSYSLIFNEIDMSLWQARGIVNSLAAAALAVGALVISSHKPQRPALSVSRPVVFYTTSMSVAGCFLALIAIGGYYVQIYGGRWGSIVQVAVLFAAIVAIAALAVSHSMRARLAVLINKHFFSHKYDYRTEWLRLIDSLTHPSAQDNFHQRAITTIASIFKSEGGGLWLLQQGQYWPAHTHNMELPHQEMTADPKSPFCRTMIEDEWVFSPHATDQDTMGHVNDQLPSWVYEIPKIWLILPLLTEQQLLGFVVLTRPTMDANLTWEDLDLLKTVGRQVASYLDRHEAAEQLAESKQFEAFNKLTAFIMHDLKNLIAQQGLVVENAAKHKDNPAFVEDAIKTIDNSVNRMSNLLRKLQQQESSEVRSLELHKVLIEAARKCQELKPSPSLRIETQALTVDADQDHLIMGLSNLIKNAQEATNSTGFVDVTLRQEDKNAVIIIEDNGAGMDEAFIRERLFKPFDTTKSGKGMGIGVYQTQELITSLGGTIEVESVIGEGTTFTVTLPASHQP